MVESSKRLRRFVSAEVPAWLAASLSAVAVLVALARSFSRSVHPYALSQYQYTYEHGFLIRGLPGELAALACGRSSDCLVSLVEVVGTLSLLAFALVLWFVVQAQSRRAPAANLTLAAFASGPLLVQLGAARGYHDALTLALGLGAYHAFVRRRFVTSVLLFGVGLLVHELVAVYILPLFALHLALSARERPLFRKQLGVVLVLSAAALAVVKLGHASPRQQREIASRLAESEHLSRGWRQYRVAGLAAAKTQATALNGARFHEIVRAPNLRYAVPLALALLLIASLLAFNRALLWFPLYAAALLAPLAILLVAWDVERLLSLAGLTALFVCLAALEQTSVRRAPLYALAATFSLAVLSYRTHYNVKGRYAYDGTLFGHERRRSERHRPR
jgi:hypothetical protein